MKKILVALMAVLLLSSLAYAAVIGSSWLWKSDKIVVQSIFADNDTAVINTSSATTAMAVQPICTRGSVLFDDITGTNIMNVTMLTSYKWDVEGTTPSAPTLFVNTIGSTSAPWHQVDPGDTDTHKFDFNSRWFNYWELQCLAGCDLTNTIGTAVGFCGKEIQ